MSLEVDDDIELYQTYLEPQLAMLDDDDDLEVVDAIDEGTDRRQRIDVMLRDTDDEDEGLLVMYDDVDVNE